MFKIIFRFLVITLIAAALGFGIYHLVQGSTAGTVQSGFHHFGRFEGGEPGLFGGLSGSLGNVLLVAAVTAAVVSIQRLFMRRPAAAVVR